MYFSVKNHQSSRTTLLANKTFRLLHFRSTLIATDGNQFKDIEKKQMRNIAIQIIRIITQTNQTLSKNKMMPNRPRSRAKLCNFRKSENLVFIQSQLFCQPETMDSVENNIDKTEALKIIILLISSSQCFYFFKYLCGFLAPAVNSIL